jgi:AraC-like DNA-binding protein
MLNIFEALRENPVGRKFEIGDLLFAHVTCPLHDGWSVQWAQHDHLVHTLTGRKTIRTVEETWTAEPGSTVYLKKGAYWLRQDTDDEMCVLMFFMPDSFIRETVRQLAPNLAPVGEQSRSTETAIRVHNDVALRAFFQAMTVFLSSAERPPDVLLVMKLKELIAALVTSPSNPVLSAYLRTLVSFGAPEIPAIMEANFRHNLPLEAFARLCHRSLSTFKREFREHYRVTPGRWLLERRLKCASRMLQTTDMSVTEIAFECGFEDSSHFSRAFKERYGRPPSAAREVDVLTAGVE